VCLYFAKGITILPGSADKDLSIVRVGLDQLVRFIMLKLTYLGSNSRFDMCVVFTTNYFLVGDDVFIDNETFLVTDFVNLKIKSAQSFRGTHRDTIYMHIFIGVNIHMCMNIYVSTIFLIKKIFQWIVGSRSGRIQ
jgi:hypothetical protein